MLCRSGFIKGVMIVPQYWAEGRVRHRAGGRQITVRRFGWSDSSPEAAQVAADQRAQDSLRRIVAGEKLDRAEHKVAYNGADGVPIREEIVSRHGEVVITRNSYGALCLNTPNALFADIDFAAQPGLQLLLIVFALSVPLALLAGEASHSRGWGFIAGLTWMILAWPLAVGLRRILQHLTGGSEHLAQRRIQRFLAKNPAWNLRLYRTPAGMRVLATHRPFFPSDPQVAVFFGALGTDRIYVRMCTNQQCFRARVTPKPWRIGINQHLRPRPGVWPVHPDRLPLRMAWVTRYEAASTGYAACRFMETMGSGVIHPEIRPVQELHDTLCRAANSNLPLA